MLEALNHSCGALSLHPRFENLWIRTITETFSHPPLLFMTDYFLCVLCFYFLSRFPVPSYVLLSLKIHQLINFIWYYINILHLCKKHVYSPDANNGKNRLNFNSDVRSNKRDKKRRWTKSKSSKLKCYPFNSVKIIL